MTQEEHIAGLQNRSEYIGRTAEQIQAHFDAYLAGDDSAFDALLTELEKLYGGMVKRQLKLANCLDDENLDEALVNARLAVWLYVQNCRTEKTGNSSVAAYCKGIYKYKAMDVIRKAASCHSEIGNILSLDGQEHPGEEEPGEGIVIRDPEGSAEDIMERNSRQLVFERLSYLYCLSLTRTNAAPPGALALYYARLLPHILHVNCGEDTIPDSKASSPKWAAARMGEKTVGALGAESERELRKYVSKDLRWSDDFRAQMEDPADGEQGGACLKDIVYTAHYTVKQIGHWADYMHQTVTHSCARYARAEGLTDLLKDYVRRRDRAWVLAEGGSDR